MQQTRLQCGSIKTISERERQREGETERERERERERRRHHYKHKTPTARDCSALLLMSPMRRGRGGCCWLLMIEIVKWISK